MVEVAAAARSTDPAAAKSGLHELATDGSARLPPHLEMWWRGAGHRRREEGRTPAEVEEEGRLTPGGAASRLCCPTPGGAASRPRCRAHARHASRPCRPPPNLARIRRIQLPSSWIWQPSTRSSRPSHHHGHLATMETKCRRREARGRAGGGGQGRARRPAVAARRRRGETRERGGEGARRGGRSARRAGRGLAKSGVRPRGGDGGGGVGAETLSVGFYTRT